MRLILSFPVFFRSRNEYTVRRAEGDYIDPCYKQKESDIYEKFWNKMPKNVLAKKLEMNVREIPDENRYILFTWGKRKGISS